MRFLNAIPKLMYATAAICLLIAALVSLHDKQTQTALLCFVAATLCEARANGKILFDQATMSNDERCENCKYCKADDEEDNENSYGICRRHPPRVVGASSGFLLAGFGLMAGHKFTQWPEADAFDWCGDYAPSEQGAAAQPPE
jgi:hypothetical protein